MQQILHSACHFYLDTLHKGATIDTMGQAGFPAMETKLIQYLFPLASGKLWPRCVPAELTVSPLLFKTLTLSQITSESRNEGQP